LLGLTLGGSGSLTLSNSANSFAGNITVSSGTLVAAASDPANGPYNPTTSVLGNPQVASRSITVNVGSLRQFTAGNMLSGANSATVSIPMSISIGSGGLVTNTANNNNVLGPVTLSGGTLTGGNGFSNTFLTWQLSAGSVTVDTAPSLMNTTVSSSS